MEINREISGVEKNGKKGLEEFHSIQEIIDELRKVDGEERNNIAGFIEKQDKEGEVSPVVIRMAMQSLKYNVPSMEQTEIFLRDLKQKDGINIQ